MTRRQKPVSKRASDRRHKASITCRSGGHGFCSGQTFVKYDKRGRPEYGRCKCSCHLQAGA